MRERSWGHKVRVRGTEFIVLEQVSLNFLWGVAHLISCHTDLPPHVNPELAWETGA